MMQEGGLELRPWRMSTYTEELRKMLYFGWTPGQGCLRGKKGIIG